MRYGNINIEDKRRFLSKILRHTEHLNKNEVNKRFKKYFIDRNIIIK